MAVTLTELPGRSSSFHADGATGIMIFKAPYSDRIEAERQLSLTTHSDSIFMFCVGVDMEPFGDYSPGTVGPKQVRLTGHYDTNVRNQTVVPSDMTDSWEFGGQALSIGDGLYWSTSTGGVDNGKRKVEDNSIVKIFPLASLNVTGILETIPSDLILTMIGQVNSDVWHGHPVETVLFEGATATKNYGIDVSDQRWRTTYRFSINTTGWNTFWNKYKTGGAGFDSVSTDPATGAGSDIFDVYIKTQNFATLLP